MTYQTIFKLAPLVIPEGLSGDLLEATRSTSEAEALLTRLQAHSDGAGPGAERREAKALFSLASAFYYHMILRDQVMQADTAIERSKAAGAAMLKAAKAARKAAEDSAAQAEAALAAARTKSAGLAEQLAAVASPDGAALAHAQAEFDASMLGSDAELQRKAARQLIDARRSDAQARALAQEERAPLVLMQEAQQAIVADLADRSMQAAQALRDAEQQERKAEATVAAVAHDASQVDALGSYVETLSVSIGAGATEKYLPVLGQSFHFVDAAHALRGQAAAGRGMVMSGEMVRMAMNEAIQPDLSPFVGFEFA
ncbi:hypothetical protein ACFPPF_06645 [Xenophilus aerolatus]|nr:hypothetical protein [Xenophilus aerolatus]